nr:hypothetical protein [Tanacetum cinerariifolium]
MSKPIPLVLVGSWDKNLTLTTLELYKIKYMVSLLVLPQFPLKPFENSTKEHPPLTESHVQQMIELNWENNCILEEILRTQEANSLVEVKEPKGGDDYMEVSYNKDKFLSDHYTAAVTPPTYTPSIPFLATIELVDTLLMGMRESNVTSDSDLKCDMPATTPLPLTNVEEVDFDINSPLGEYVVEFLMETEDVAGLPRHSVK